MWLIFGLAVIARLVAAAVLNIALDRIPDRQFLIEGDASGYWILAHKIVDGEDFSLYNPPRYVMRMPGFPAVLAGSIAVFGDNLHAARYLLAILTSLAVFPACWLGFRHSKWAGYLAGLIVAVMPSFVAFSVTILSECLFAVAIIWNIWAMVRWMEADSNWESQLGWAALTGALGAIAVYIRPSWLLFPLAMVPIIVLWSKAKLSMRLFSPLAMAACLLVTLLPWGIRNQQVTGHFVLTTLWMGPSLYDGLHPQATGDSDMTFFEQDRVLERMSEYEMNQHYKDLALEFAKANPSRAFELGLIKLERYWNLLPNAAQFQHPGIRWILALSAIFLFAGAIYGVWVMRMSLGFVFLCTLPIVYFSALHTLFVSSLRYRLPAEYSLAVITAIGWIALAERFRRTKSEQPQTTTD
ncbi:ArnT family glycosyltransferase [Rubinisphaera margarita]|uniref:ArnT family glycosyltransferase n=1 Tax=Rubinisphaera margarita TaxID=2909586 RepID=UPI001EE98676|nr:glycosyltransferase family 39 protein [Rubinisphaera margarita]MCG6157919.1 glycosyltransferase family 39 protein [Rubinisphaera margarita]